MTTGSAQMNRSGQGIMLSGSLTEPFPFDSNSISSGGISTTLPSRQEMMGWPKSLWRRSADCTAWPMAFAMRSLSLKNSSIFCDSVFAMASVLLNLSPCRSIRDIFYCTFTFGQENRQLWLRVVVKLPRIRHRLVKSEEVVQAALITPPHGVVRHEMSARLFSRVNPLDRFFGRRQPQKDEPKDKPARLQFPDPRREALS